MDESFLPAVRNIQYHSAAVEKDIKKLPKPAKERLAELLDDLKNGKVPRTGKNIAHVGNVKKYRLDERYRVAFSLLKDGTAEIFLVLATTGRWKNTRIELNEKHENVENQEAERTLNNPCYSNPILQPQPRLFHPPRRSIHPRSLRRRKIHFNGQVWVGIMGRAVEKCQAVKRL